MRLGNQCCHCCGMVGQRSEEAPDRGAVRANLRANLSNSCQQHNMLATSRQLKDVCLQSGGACCTCGRRIAGCSARLRHRRSRHPSAALPAAMLAGQEALSGAACKVRLPMRWMARWHRRRSMPCRLSTPSLVVSLPPSSWPLPREPQRDDTALTSRKLSITFIHHPAGPQGSQHNTQGRTTRSELARSNKTITCGLWINDAASAPSRLCSFRDTSQPEPV